MRFDSTLQFKLTRRKALLTALSAAAVPLGSHIAEAATYPELRLRFYNLHTTEHLNIVFWADGQYDPDAFKQINNLLRDHRTGGIKQIDPRLMSILFLINQKVGNNNPISVISGYRSKETNRKLAQLNSGVAKDSFHIKGQAIDIRIPGIDTKNIRNAGQHVRLGGVGLYCKSNFTHIDTGPRRHWDS